MCKSYLFVGCGELIVDKIYKKKEDSFNLIKQEGGGTVSNILANLSYNNQEAILVGTCGNDQEADIAINSLNKLNIDTNYINKTKQKTNCINIIIPEGDVSDNSVKHSIINPITNDITYKNKTLKYIKFSEQILSRNKVFIFDRLNSQNLDIIKNKSGINDMFSIDIGHRGIIRFLSSDYIKSFLDKMSYVQVNIKSLKMLLNKFNVENEEELFSLINTEVLTITKASEGSKTLYRDKNKETHDFNYKAISTNVIDTSGAGDAFFSVMLKNIASIKSDNINIDKENIECFVKEASEYAIKAIAYVGARGHINIKASNRMEYNYNKIFERVSEAHEFNKYDMFKERFDKLSGNILVVGTGGSYVVTQYIKEILSDDQDKFVVCMKPRDALFENVKKYDHVIIITYSGKTPELIKVFNKYKKYKNIKEILVITRAKESDIIGKWNPRGCDKIISYYSTLPREKSFISISATIIPISYMFRYKNKYSYDIFITEFNRIIKKYSNENNFLNLTNIEENIHIVSSKETVCSAVLLESIFIESGIANVVIHEKKDLSHGRVTIFDKEFKQTVIYLCNNVVRYDNVLIEYLKHYKNIKMIMLNERITDKFEMLIEVFYFCKHVANINNIDLSKIKYFPDVRKIYSYNSKLI